MIVVCTFGWPKKWKFCDSGQMMGEVNKNDFTFTTFDFVNYSAEQSTTTKTKKYIVRMRRFFLMERSR